MSDTVKPHRQSAAAKLSSATGKSKAQPLTEADRALLEAEPDWERMGQAAKRLLSEKPDQADAAKTLIRKPRF